MRPWPARPSSPARRRRATSRSRGSAEPRFTSTLVEPKATTRSHSILAPPVPLGKGIERTAADDRVHLRRQCRQRAEIPAQPQPARALVLWLPRQRGDAPALAQQPAQQGPPDLAAASEHQRVLHCPPTCRSGSTARNHANPSTAANTDAPSMPSHRSS
jgi:hypothetical protein